MIQLGNCEAKPWNRGRRGDFCKHAKKPHVSNRDGWDWSLSNCELGRIYGMSPQAVRKTRIKLGKENFRKPKQQKVYKLWMGEHAPQAKTINLGVGLSFRGPKPRSWQERFWEKVNKGKPDQCWEWSGNRNRKGYGNMVVGTFGITRRTYPAHRLSYLIKHGSLPAGKVVRHKCDNPKCVNPNHLEIGLPVHNIRDAVERLGMNQGEKNGNSKVTRELVLEMRQLYAVGARIFQIAAATRLSHSTVHGIVKQKRWRHV